MENTPTQQGYSGFRPKADWKIGKVSADIAPELFFKDYVCTRTPVIIDGLLTDENWKGKLWDNDYLISKAGSAKIKVEQSDSHGNFGSDLPRLEMTFKEFLEKISAGAENLYLTTQYEEEENEDDSESKEGDGENEGEEQGDFNAVIRGNFLKSLLAPPAHLLVDDVPLRPKILGNLIPAQFNMWMGNSKSGTSTGLHHDFQDNLYLLLRGEKQFTLICPSEAPNLYTNGKVETVHPNGYIAYKGVPKARADGAPLIDILLNEQHNLLENLEDEGNAAEIAKIEQKRMELLQQLKKDKGGEEEDSDEEDEDEDKENKGDKEKKEKKENKEPNHFSRIPTPVLHGKQKSSDFPLISNVSKFTFALQPNQMLYLPTGWFHEVFSKSVGSDKAKPGHFAFNFWCHAPTVTSFENPYEDDWWKSSWDNTQAIIKGEIELVAVDEEDEEGEGEEGDEEEEEEEEEEEPPKEPPNKRRRF